MSESVDPDAVAARRWWAGPRPAYAGNEHSWVVGTMESLDTTMAYAGVFKAWQVRAMQRDEG